MKQPTMNKITRAGVVTVMLMVAQGASAFYDASLGRWLNRDPLGESAGPNLYTFVENNPVRFIDPYGLLVFGTYDVGSGLLAVTDEDSGQTQIINADRKSVV